MTTKPLPYPILLDLQGVSVLVVGGGRVALRKVNTLLEAGAKVGVVAPRVVPELRTLANEEKINLWLIYFNPRVLTDQGLVYACTNDPAVNAEIARLAQEKGLWVNVADDSAPGNFTVPAQLKREGVQVTVSTGHPMLSAKLRDELEQSLGFGYSRLLDVLEQARQRLREEVPEQPRRKEILARFLGGLSIKDLLALSPEELQARLQSCLSSSSE